MSAYLDDVKARRRLGKAMLGIGRPLLAGMTLAGMYNAIAQAIEDYAALRAEHARVTGETEAAPEATGREPRRNG